MVFKNSGPEKIPLSPENGPDKKKEDARKSNEKHEAKNQIESGSQSALNSLKESLVKKENKELLADADWLGKNEKTPEKPTLEGQRDFTASLEADHVTYFSGKRSDRVIGKNPLLDVQDLGIGLTDSLVDTARLGGHIVTDAFRLMRHPIAEFQRTRERLEN